MLPVLIQLRQQIINGEHIDFGLLLSKCSYDDAGNTTSSHTHTINCYLITSHLDGGMEHSCYDYA